MVISHERGKQPASRNGLGTNFQSPKRKRSSYYKTTKTAWKIFNPESEKRNLMMQMAEMYAGKRGDSAKARVVSGNHVSHVLPDLLLEEDRGAVDLDVGTSPSAVNASPKRLAPDQSERNLYATWNSLLPTLVEDILSYTSATVGLPERVAESTLSSNCQAVPQNCVTKTTQVLCLYLNREWVRKYREP